MNKLELTRFKQVNYACREAVNTLCTNLKFAGKDKKRIMITSCVAHEGKTFVAINMMRTLAKLGQKVILVDADLRKSQISVRYGMHITEGNGFGLAHYLAGMCPMEEIIYETDISGAYMIPVGHEVTNSLALLTTQMLPDLLSRLAEEYDYVIVDAPPVGVIIDAAEIAKHCDGTIFAVKYNAVSRRELDEAKHQIERTGCTIIGAVLNEVTFDTLSSKKYYYRSYYYSHYNHYDYYAPRHNKSSKNPLKKLFGKK